MCSREDNQQERMFFVIKYRCISAAPNRPAKGYSTYKDKTDQQRATTPTRTSGLQSFGTPFNQFPNILDTLLGLGKPQAA